MERYFYLKRDGLSNICRLNKTQIIKRIKWWFKNINTCNFVEISNKKYYTVIWKDDYEESSDVNKLILDEIEELERAE